MDVDKLIGIVSILFLLSFVVENITFFLRKYFFPKTARNSQRFKNFWYGRFAGTENLGVDEPAGQVIGASVLVGIIVSFLFNVDLFAMFKTADPTAVIAFIGEKGKGIGWLNLPGIIISGFFLSLGSKLFHDLLDLILQIKNTKKSIASATGSFSNFKTADAVKQITSAQNIDPLIKTYIREHITEIKKWGKVVSVSTFLSEFRGELFNGIKVGLEDDVVQSVPATITITLPDGSARNIPIEKEVNLGTPMLTTLRSGDSLRNIEAPETAFGSAGITLMDPDTDDVFVCTCYHVVNREGHWQAWRPFQKDQIVIGSQNGDEKGKMILAVLNNQLDVALVQVQKGIKIDTNIWGKGNVRAWRTTGLSDEGKTKVAIRGAGSIEIQKGVIVETGAAFVNIPYPILGSHDLFDTIRVQGRSSDGQLGPITKGGDSGTLVVADDNKAIGIVVGKDRRYTYVIPIENILTFPYFDHFEIYN